MKTTDAFVLSQMYSSLMASSQDQVSRSPEPLDCSSPVLNLSMKRRSPSPPITHLETSNSFSPPHTSIQPEPSLNTCVISSSSPDSENSAMSANSYYEQYSHLAVQTATANRLKIPRPFKAYPKDPLSLATGVNAAVFDEKSLKEYARYRNRMLSRIHVSNGVTNKNMRRISQSNKIRHDPTYWEKRKKNNEAAKRSRDARRAKEDEIAIRAAFLEQENMRLKCELANARNDLNGMKQLMYNPNCAKLGTPFVSMEYNN